MRYFVIAGEASGDLHGANLARALRELDPQVELLGMGGVESQTLSDENMAIVRVMLEGITRADSSVTGLMPQLLELTGAGRTRWWALQDRIRRFSLTDTDLYFVDGEGEAYFSAEEAPLTDEERELIQLKRAVTYDAFYGKRYITGQMNEYVGQ